MCLLRVADEGKRLSGNRPELHSGKMGASYREARLAGPDSDQLPPAADCAANLLGLHACSGISGGVSAFRRHPLGCAQRPESGSPFDAILGAWRAAVNAIFVVGLSAEVHLVRPPVATAERIISAMFSISVGAR